MSHPLIPRYILLWRKQMVTVLPGCAVRNLHIATAIFYLIGNAETGWEFQTMSTEKSCFLSEGSTFKERSSLPFLCSAVLQPSAGKPWSRVTREPSPILRGERQIPPEGPVPAAAWLGSWTRHARQRGEDICSMAQCRALGAKAPKQSK